MTFEQLRLRFHPNSAWPRDCGLLGAVGATVILNCCYGYKMSQAKGLQYSSYSNMVVLNSCTSWDAFTLTQDTWDWQSTKVFSMKWAIFYLRPSNFISLLDLLYWINLIFVSFLIFQTYLAFTTYKHQKKTPQAFLWPLCLEILKISGEDRWRWSLRHVPGLGSFLVEKVGIHFGFSQQFGTVFHT